MDAPRVESQAPALNADLVEALRYGNIPEILRKVEDLGVSRADIERYLAHQTARLHRDVYQDSPLYAPVPGMISAPSVDQFAVHRKEMEMTTDDRNLFKQSFGKALAVRGLKGVEGENPADPVDPYAIGNDLIGAANDLSNKIVETGMFNQMQQDLEKTRQELHRQFDEILALYKSGQATEEVLIAALAKVSATENGVLVTHIGQRIWHTMDIEKQVTQNIPNVMDPDFNKKQTDVRVTQMTAQQNIQFDTMTLQRVMGNIDAITSFAASEIRAAGTFKSDMLRRIGLG